MYGFFHTNNQFSKYLDSNWVSYNSVPFWHNYAELESDSTGLRTQSHRTAPPCRHQWKLPGCHLYFWPISCESRVPVTFSSDLMICWSSSQNSGQHFTSIYCCIIKNIIMDTNERSNEEVHRTRNRKGKCLQTLGIPPSQHLDVDTNLHGSPKNLIIGVFMEISSLMCDWLNHWLSCLSQSPALLPSLEVGGGA